MPRQRPIAAQMTDIADPRANSRFPSHRFLVIYRSTTRQASNSLMISRARDTGFHNSFDTGLQGRGQARRLAMLPELLRQPLTPRSPKQFSVTAHTSRLARLDGGKL